MSKDASHLVEPAVYGSCDASTVGAALFTLANERVRGISKETRERHGSVYAAKESWKKPASEH
jgi:hypothetical protein